METFKEVVENFMQNKLVASIIIVIFSYLIYRIFHRIIKDGEKKSELKNNVSNKSKTYFKLMISIIRYVFIIVTILVILQINGINVSSMLAGLGILSVIIGLAVQDALKDIIRGASILSDNYFQVGDIVYLYQSKKVHKITAKTIVTQIDLENKSEQDTQYWVNPEDYKDDIARYFKIWRN